METCKGLRLRLHHIENDESRHLCVTLTCLSDTKFKDPGLVTCKLIANKSCFVDMSGFEWLINGKVNRNLSVVLNFHLIHGVYYLRLICSENYMISAVFADIVVAVKTKQKKHVVQNIVFSDLVQEKQNILLIE